MTGLLDGVRVIDLSRVLAGPFAAQILGEMGADVIKVEAPAGDSGRGIGPFINGRSLYFSSLNTTKRGVVLDLTTPPGRRGLEALLDTADIVVENYRPAAARKLGLTPSELMTRHSGLVVVTVSSYARGSSLEDEGSFDLIAQAESGIMSVTGETGGAPVRAGVAISDLAAGLWAALGGVAAYSQRLKSGTGAHVEVPLMDAAYSLLTYVATSALETGVDPGPVGSGHHNIVPYRAFATTDGWVVIAVLGDKFWPLLCTAIGRDDLAVRADLMKNEQRAAARAEVDEAIEVAVAGMTTAEALEKLKTSGVPHAPINTILQGLGVPYARERDVVTEVDSPQGPYSVVQGPLRDHRAPRPAPALGEHTAEIMTDVLGPDSPDLAALIGD